MIEEKFIYRSIDVSKMDIIVSEGKIEAPTAYMNDEGMVMVPLRAIAEALEYEVNWEAEIKTVRVGKAISLTIDKDYYTSARMAPISLGGAPELIQGRTYVPLNFFREVMGMNNAYVHGGHIVIDNDEIME